MNKKPILILTALGAAIMLLSVGCTKDDNYSKEKMANINTEMTLFEKGVAIAMNESKTVKLSEVIKTSDNIRVDAQTGDYCLYAAGKTDGATIDIPEIDLSDTEFELYSYNVTTGSIAGQTIQVDKVVSTIDQESYFYIEDELPDNVIGIKRLDVDGNLLLTLKTNTEIGYLAKGFKFTFCKGFTFVQGSDDASFTVEQVDGCSVVTLAMDIFPGEKGVVFDLDLVEIDFTQLDEPVKDGKILLSGLFTINGDIGLRGKAKIPSTLSVTIQPEMQGVLAVQGGNLALDIQTEVEDKSVDIKLPEELKKDAKILFSEPSVSINIKNPTPVPFAFSADIEGSKDGKSVAKAIEIEDFKVEAGGTTTLVLNTKSYPGVKDLINALPDKITLKNIYIDNVSKENYIEIDLEECETSVGIAYELDTPFKVDKGSYVNFNTTAKNEINIEKMKAKSFTLEFNAVNGMPLDIDTQMSINISGKDYPVSPSSIIIPAGQETTATATVTGDLTFDKIGDITIKGKGTAPKDGSQLNANQELGIKITKISFPNGITVTSD